MLRNRTFLVLLLAALSVAFVCGLVTLFQLRFEHGDIYPAYSSLRTDPLGTKVFYEGLETIPALAVDRLYEPLNKIATARSKTLFILGTEPEALIHVPEQEAKELNQFMVDGGRIIISFQPVAKKKWSIRRQEARESEEKGVGKPDRTKSDKKYTPKSDKGKKKKKYQDPEDSVAKLVSLAEKWNFQFKYEDLNIDENGVTEMVTVRRVEANNTLPKTLSWHTALYFDDLGGDWRKVYSRGTNAILMERSFGKGTLVMASDSYFASNEAMRQERQPDLLAWLVGVNTQILFDETHLGVEIDPGIAALARKYRLHGLIGGLILLAALFVWKNSSYFVPPIEEGSAFDSAQVVTGKDSASGFTNLLRRTIAPADILSVCVAEWNKACAHGRHTLVTKAQEIEALVKHESSQPSRERNPVQTYQRIAAILSKKKSL